jgi:hypothetical protein
MLEIPRSSPATGTPQGPAPVTPQGDTDLLPAQARDVFSQKQDGIEKEIRNLGQRIDDLKGQMIVHQKKADKLQTAINRTILWAFCPTTMGVIFGPLLLTGIQMPLMGLFIAEAAAAGVLKFFEHREEKSIAPLAQEAFTLNQQKERLEMEGKSVRDFSEMVGGTDEKPSDISDEEDFVVIDGIKLKKQSDETMKMLRTVFRRDDQRA